MKYVCYVTLQCAKCSNPTQWTIRDVYGIFIGNFHKLCSCEITRRQTSNPPRETRGQEPAGLTGMTRRKAKKMIDLNYGTTSFGQMPSHKRTSTI